MLAGLPLFHVNALIVTGIAPMFSGARVVWPGPAGYRDPDPVRPGSGRSSSTTRSRPCPPYPTVYATLAQVPVDADIGTLRLADRRCGPAA